MADAVIRIGGNDIKVINRGGQGPRGFSGPSLTDLADADGASLIGAGDVTVQEGLNALTSRANESRSALNAFQSFMAWLSSYNEATAPVTLVYDFGSSVGNGAGLGADAATQNPGAYFYTKAEAFFDPLDIFNFSRTNGSVDGSTLSAMAALWASTIAPAAPKLSFGVPGMNDFQMSQWNANQTFDPFYGSPSYLRSILEEAKQIGCTVVLSTSPHPHVGRLTYNFFGENPAFDQVYPVAVTAPVAAGSVVPTPTESAPEIPWKGESIQIDARFLRGNDMIRRLAIEYGCPLVDAERKQFDLLSAGHTYDDMYDGTETVHPNLWTIQQTYHAATDDMFDGMRNDYVVNAPVDRAIARQQLVVRPDLASNATAAEVDAESSVDLQVASGERHIMRNSEGKAALWLTDAFEPKVYERFFDADFNVAFAPYRQRRCLIGSTAQDFAIPDGHYFYGHAIGYRNDLGSTIYRVAGCRIAGTLTLTASIAHDAAPSLDVMSVGVNGANLRVTPPDTSAPATYFLDLTYQPLAYEAT